MTEGTYVFIREKHEWISGKVLQVLSTLSGEPVYKLHCFYDDECRYVRRKDALTAQEYDEHMAACALAL